MANYDFHKLNPLDFERLCCEVLCLKMHVSYHTFREGRDGGIDILKADDLSDAVIFQCKRYASRKELLDKLRREELQKVQKLNPRRYGLMTSLKLKAQDKQDIKDLFTPYIESLEHIYDACDLNACLDLEEARAIVYHYPALWMQGFHVVTRILNNDIIGRSKDFVEDFASSASLYVWTDATSAALRRLEKEHVVVLTGDPGVGKTVTAELLLSYAVSVGFEPVVTFRDIRDFERVFDVTHKQVFYFDDFLGHQILDAALMAESRGVCAFIRRVQRDDKKLFILTSRTTIVNQGVSLSSVLGNFWRTSPSYLYRVENYSNWDKARILCSHMMSSTLPTSLVSQIFVRQSYWKILEHRNFNPRIIGLVFSNRMRYEIDVKCCFVDEVRRWLDSPDEIWKDLFEKTLSSSERLIVWTVFLMPKIKDDKLRTVFTKHLLIQGNDKVGNVEYDKSIETLSGSILIRKMDRSGVVSYDLMNPSVGDFLLSRMTKDVVWMRDVVLSVTDYRIVDKIRELRFRQSCDSSLIGKIYSEIDAMVRFCENPEFVIAIWRELLELNVPDGCMRVVAQIHVPDLESVDVGNCDCLVSVLGFLDARGVDLRRKIGLTFSSDVVDRWIQGCDDIEDVALMYKLVVKYHAEIPPNMNTCLTNCMMARAWNMAGELLEPEYVRDEWGHSYIPDWEEDRLRDEIKEGILKLLEELAIPATLVDVWECAHDPDLSQIFNPSDYRSDYDDEYAKDLGRAVWQERESINRYFWAVQKTYFGENA